MTQIPRVPDGPGPLVEWCRKLRECVIERTIHPSPDVLLTKTPTGVSLKVRKTPGRGGGSSNDKPVWL